MFYLLLVPVSIWMLLELRHLLQLRKHDRVLFPFCRIRGDITMFLMRHSDEITAEDYLYARRMLVATNHVVSMYQDHRWRLFNFRTFLRFLRGYKLTAQEIACIPRTSRPELQEFDRRLNAAMFRGFICYTPFLRSELLARILVAILTFLGRMGFSFIAVRVKEVRELISTVRSQAAELGDNGSIMAT